MAEVVKIEPSLFRKDEAWFHMSDGRKLLRKREREGNASRSSIGFPMLMSRSFDEPVQSMADGRYYSDKAALENSYKAANNPQGVDYVCIGNETSVCTDFKPKKRDDEAAHRAIARVLDEAGI